MYQTTMDIVPDHVVEQCLLPVMDAASLLAFAKASRSLRRMVRLHIDEHMRTKKRVVDSIDTLQQIVSRDRSRRFRAVFNEVFHHWFFHTRLDNHTRWILSEEVEIVRHPKPRGHKRWWCYTCGGTLRCEHFSRR